METLQELLTDELRDLYDAEKQLVRALPRIAKAISNEELKQAFMQHVEVTQGQVQRIEQVFEQLGERAKSKPCKAMKGLLEEGQELISEHDKGPMLDSALIVAQQKIEHYEIAGYGSARAMAKSLGLKEPMGLLQETLREEEQTDKQLTQIALRLQKEAIAMESGSEEEEQEQPSRGRGGRASSRGNSGGSARKSAARSEGSNGAQKKKTPRGANGAGRSKGGKSGASSGVTTDHEFIREWAEERGAQPACVRGTGKKGDTGMIRLDFPGFSGEGSLQPISWDEWFESFDQNNLALAYQEETAGGEKSNFNKLVSRERAESGGRGRR